jgi:hypothetical protein
MLLRGTELDHERGRLAMRDSGGAMPMVIASDSFSTDEWLAMARLSEALRLTEGAHPTTFTELRRIADELRPDTARWMPAAQEV